jgi:hypothetical protein
MHEVEMKAEAPKDPGPVYHAMLAVVWFGWAGFLNW